MDISQYSNQFPNWESNFHVGRLRSERILRLMLWIGDEQKKLYARIEVLHDEVLLLKEIDHIRDFLEGPEGIKYVHWELSSKEIANTPATSSLDDKGVLYRIESFQD